jgi:hypothetical protein
LRNWPVRCVLERGRLPPAALDHPAFWYVAFHDEEDREIARLDANRPELIDLLGRPGSEIILEREVLSHRPPTRWTVWPTDRRRLWLAPVHGRIEPADSSF